ncbi:alpha/beta hydrolase family protein [Aeromicrobium sp. CF4.19]|uniref:alpha/beta hydrolase family protein n=1 Tax=Aeromicrobium sp. CF4.19 TaxID=3373082 RepID=UPI003EE7B254
MRAGVLLLAVVLVLTGCTGEPDPAPSTSPSAEPSPTPTTSPTPTPTYDPASLGAALDDEVTGGDLERVGPAQDVGPYTRQEVRYSSDDVRVSGVLLVPDGEGPFPAVVLNHGYIDPAAYVTGQGMQREQDYRPQALRRAPCREVPPAREGWVVLHTDYRGHAGSDDVGPLEQELRVGYARDAIAGVETLRELESVDPDRVAMFGRSMGGGVTLNALTIAPDVVDAAVVHASVSSRFEDNLSQFTERSRPDRVASMRERWGSPREAPDFWDSLSSRTYADRVEADVLMIHGEQDDTCPVDWARDTEESFTEAGADVTLRLYEGEGHTFERRVGGLHAPHGRLPRAADRWLSA